MSHQLNYINSTGKDLNYGWLESLSEAITNISNCPLYLEYENTRLYDYSEHTDDPGNTILLMAYIPMEEELPTIGLDNLVREIKTNLEKIFDSSGSHIEEVIVTYQNSEVLIILNAIS